MRSYSQNEVIQMLKKFNISVTIQRIGILNYLLHTTSHPSVEEIYHQIRTQFPTVSKATVYNTLMAFKDAHLIQEITIEKDRARYDGNNEPHGHFYCKSCEKVLDVDCDVKLEDEKSEVDGYQVYFYGTCSSCK